MVLARHRLIPTGRALLGAVAVAVLSHQVRADPAAPTGSLETRRQELQDATAAADKAEAERRATEAEVAALRDDHAKLAAALVETTARVHAAEEEATAGERRLDLLSGSEAATRTSLASRRGEIAIVLGALQRLGRHPQPAILVSPEDMLGAIRTAILLGALIPELKDKAEALASDLEDLRRLKAGIAAEHDRLTSTLKTLGTERDRLALLVSARQAAQLRAEAVLAARKASAATLAGQASGLRDLVNRLQDEADKARAAEEARRTAAEAEARGVDEKAAALVGLDAPRLTPARAFAEIKGSLALPVAGTLVSDYGASDPAGGETRGLSLETRPGAVVSAPADATVSFAGPYRSYGQVLILDGGGGYYIVLAGLGRAEVVTGQFVLAGEPLGTMGEGGRSVAGNALGAAKPVLYVELRKDGVPIDPGPWWAKAGQEKVRG